MIAEGYERLVSSTLPPGGNTVTEAGSHVRGSPWLRPSGLEIPDLGFP
jgi:hypothetical protein